MQQDRAIPALTGLRFAAALSVLLSHAMQKIMPFPGTPPEWSIFVSGLAAEGMTLFFVLSGFVIHYNYSGSIRANVGRGVLNFFIARFARLYPLFLLGLAIDLAISFANQQLPASTAAALPYYLSFTQSWFYVPMGGHSLIYQFGVIPSVAWSVSTEWFFYIAYPLVALCLARSLGAWRGLLIAVSITGTAYALGLTTYLWSADINAYARDVFGAIADIAAPQDSFLRWLTYFSPYYRIFEFLLGCLCAAIFKDIRDIAVSREEQRTGNLLMVGAVVGALILHLIAMGPADDSKSSVLGFLGFYGPSFGAAPFIAVIVFCCARYDSPVASLFSSWPMTLGGEASYSLYLLHMMVVDAFRWEAAPVTAPSVALGCLVRLIVTVLSAIGLAIVVWRIVEVPSRRWLRKVLLPRPEPRKAGLRPA
jgi:peptidoglycan/LPS O-acetylase OafA/YrhL